jgi:hypothetical protein
MFGLKSRGPAMRLCAMTIGAISALPIVTAEAALPPYYQRAAELEAIIHSGDVEASLMEAPIDTIERTGEDIYRVTGGPCVVEVRIVDDTSVDHPDGWVGPREFVLEVGEATCE